MRIIVLRFFSPVNMILSARISPIVWLASLLLLAVLVVTATAGDWPHWRGPDRNDVSNESSGWPRKSWPAEKPAWKVQLGVGSSSPIVVGKQLFAMGWKNNQEHLYCLDAANGKRLWKVSYRCPKFGRVALGDQGQYAGPSATPEYDPKTGLLYTLSIDGDLNCWDTRAKGRKMWGFNLYKRYRVKRRPNVGRSKRMWRDYGYTCAPLIQGDALLVEVGAQAGTIIAYDKRTGRQLWTSEYKREAGHSGGLVPMTVEGVPCVAVLTLRDLLVVRLDKGNEGKTVATYKWTTDFANNIPTPAVKDNYIVITSAYNHLAVCKLKIALDGATREWEIRRIASGVCSPVIHKGYVYWAWRKVYCLDFDTGRIKWAGGRLGSQGSCIITSDDRLVIWCNYGDLKLAETAVRSPNEYRELARRTGLGRREAWPHVVFANGHLYCKDRNGTLFCFSLSG